MDEYVWHIDQFRFNETQVTGQYDYITKVGPQETIKLVKLYNSCITFLKECESPQYVELKTLQNLKTFGIEGFTEDTWVKLYKWAIAIKILSELISQNVNVNYKSEQDANNFGKLVSICQNICQRIDNLNNEKSSKPVVEDTKKAETSQKK